MNRNFFTDHLRYINDWWEFMVDWEGGGIFCYPELFTKRPAGNAKALLMHVRQLYNYCVGHEHGHPRSEEIARHLYATLDTVFTDREGELFYARSRRSGRAPLVDGYQNAYVVIGLSRYARTFHDREAAERALRVYDAIDRTLTHAPLRKTGTWNYWDPVDDRKFGKTDNSLMHRCEGALNLLRALETSAPDLAETHRDRLVSQVDDMAHYFNAVIARPEDGYTVENFQDDSTPYPHNDDIPQSLAHAFEWVGFCFEFEAHCGLRFDFLDTRSRTLAQNALSNGLAPNGCYRNSYVPRMKAGPLRGDFWPQVEAPLGVLWARKRWGEDAFPLENAERMLDFYTRFFFQREEYGGGILNHVSENGVPVELSRGHRFKCDHHAVRLCEKVLEYDLVP